METKKHKSSELKWKESENLGSFKITSNRGKSAEGIVHKVKEGQFLALIEKTNYSKSYAHKKVQSILSLIFENSAEKITIQNAMVCKDGYLFTDFSWSNDLVLDQEFTFTGNYTSFCVSGAPDCGGKTHQGPTSAIYRGIVIGVCTGQPTKYAKFKIV